MRKLSVILLSCICVLALTIPSPLHAVSDSEFAASESYYRDLCTGTIESSNRETCRDFQSYLNRKLEDQQKEIDDLNTKITAIRNDITEQAKILQEQVKIIEKAELEIEQLNELIVAIKTDIKRIETDITNRLKEIEKIKDKIKARVVAQQSSLHQNKMVDFIFGTTSLTELVHRIFVVNKITEVDQKQIDEYTEQKRLLQLDQDEANKQKVALEDSLAQVKSWKQTAEVAKQKQEEIIANFLSREAELEEAQRNASSAKSASASDIESIKSAISTLDTTIVNDDGSTSHITHTADGWIYPIAGSFYVSAGAWYYPESFGGGVHYGVDLANNVGTPLVAAGPGVILGTHTGCDTYGYLGNSCGDYGGNSVTMVVSINGRLYGIIYAHMSEVYVSRGQSVNQGTNIGTLGSSGNSTGPHLHFETYYLGESSLTDYINNWNGSLYFSSDGSYMNLSSRCEVKSPPCRINAQELLGLSVGRWY